MLGAEALLGAGHSRRAAAVADSMAVEAVEVEVLADSTLQRSVHSSAAVARRNEIVVEAHRPTVAAEAVQAVAVVP